MTEPFELTVAEAANRIRRGDLSSLDLAESLLARLGRLEPDLRAWVTIDREGVLEAARQRDRELEEAGPRGPLHGIPVGLKDIFYTAGMKTAAGSKVYADFVPAYDATCAAGLKEAGRRHPGEGGNHRVRLRRPFAYPQPLEPGPHPRRLQQRLGGGRGLSHVPRRPGPPRPAGPPAGPRRTTASSASSRPTAGSAATE